ncbi:hypothetical protein AMS68_003764 [Peltaster fructicola]|uniref:Phosphogluconate dehydrogenase NAD-binding putative C-terminal domain-containing protein n=1 Tax=Peltaster fructicola TaxID=286661 RepID=A0A6H0XTZ9_9PEZI|nr:hypothetical protein AMS68_003764 [Peltaster fructicola]
MAVPLATVAILSIGDMGAANTRSESTQQRARASNIELLTSDVDLCNQADYVLSIVPQKDALSVANRIVAAVNDVTFAARPHPLYFLDLNAVSPQTARNTAELFATSASTIKFIDGGIISGPPKLKDDGSWTRPRLVVSGPVKVNEGPSGEHFASTVNIQHIDATIGSASALKMCFAAMSKGFAAIAIQSFTTAQRFGLVDNLEELLDEYNPTFARSANRLLPSMPPKAYRWVQEMLEIAETFELDGHFSKEENIFRPISELYTLVAHGTELGNEQTDNRQRGKTSKDVATLMTQGIDQRWS